MPKKIGTNPDKMEEGYAADEETSGTKKKTAKPPLEPEKLLQKFKTNFTSHLKESAKNRVNYQTPRINRRLDSLARLLEGKNICTAVSYDSQNKKILIAANTIFSGSEPNNLYIGFIKQAMGLLIDHDSSILVILEKLSNLIAINLSQEHRIPVHDFKKKSEITHPQFSNIINQLLLNLFKSGLTTKAWRDNIEDVQFDDPLIQQLSEEKVFAKIIARTSRIARDFMKLRHALYREHRILPLAQEELITAIKNSQQHKLVRRGKKDLHVEMRILEERTAQKNLDGSYIGISKLCCDHCGLAVEVTNPWEDAQKIVRGKHGQGPKKWFLPAFLKQDEDLLKAYMGDDAYQAYQQLPNLQQKEALNFIESKDSSPYKMGKRSMQPDSSDSDEEFGFTCSEEEIEECLNKINYQDIWTFRAIKNNYKEELYRLLSLEIPINDILSTYKGSPDKLAAIGKKSVCTLLQQTDDDPSELFEKLSETYDKNKTMFEDLVDDPENLIEEYGFDDVLEQYEYFLRTVEEFDEDGNQTDFYTLTANKLTKENKSGYEYGSDDSQNIRSDSDSERNSNYSNPSGSEQEEIYDSDEEETNYYSP